MSETDSAAEHQKTVNELRLRKNLEAIRDPNVAMDHERLAAGWASSSLEKKPTVDEEGKLEDKQLSNLLDTIHGEISSSAKSLKKDQEAYSRKVPKVTDSSDTRRISISSDLRREGFYNVQHVTHIDTDSFDPYGNIDDDPITLPYTKVEVNAKIADAMPDKFAVNVYAEKTDSDGQRTLYDVTLLNEDGKWTDISGQNPTEAYQWAGIDDATRLTNQGRLQVPESSPQQKDLNTAELIDKINPQE